MSEVQIHAIFCRLLAACFVALLGLSAGGCTNAPQPTKQPSGATASLTEALDKFGNKSLDAGAPAVLVQARVRGEQWSRASGVLSLESQEPAHIDGRMHVASVTKSFVAVSVLKLVADGRIALDDPVSRHLPNFESVMHPPGLVTVRHFLNHQSGMPDYVIPLFQRGSVPDVLRTRLNSQERLNLASSFRWSGTPGLGFEYSSANYAALGMIVERLRGQPIGAVLRSDVVDPLGLSGTSMTEPGPSRKECYMDTSRYSANDTLPPVLNSPSPHPAED
ncbi:serine hydrolase domain-containing protein [Arthrobacter humicola]